MILQASKSPGLSPFPTFELAINLNKREATLLMSAPPITFFGAKLLDKNLPAPIALRTFKIAAGKIGNWSPSTSINYAQIVIRPPYTPTDGGEQQGADQTDSGTPKNPLGRVLLFVVDGPYRGHGTSHPESMGRYASGGCIRFRPEDAEAIAAMIMSSTPLQAINLQTPPDGATFTKLLSQKKTYYVDLARPFRVRLNYTCWEGNGIKLEDGKLGITILPDPYGVLKVNAAGLPAAETPPDGCPFNLKLKGNAITFSQFKTSLAENGITLREGKTDADLKKVYLALRKEVTAFTQQSLSLRGQEKATVKKSGAEVQISRAEGRIGKGKESRRVQLNAEGILQFGAPVMAEGQKRAAKIAQ